MFRLIKVIQRCCVEQTFQGGFQTAQCSEAANLFQKSIQNMSTKVTTQFMKRAGATTAVRILTEEE